MVNIHGGQYIGILRYIVFFKKSKKINELKKKVEGGPSKNTKKVCFFVYFAYFGKKIFEK